MWRGRGEWRGAWRNPLLLLLGNGEREEGPRVNVGVALWWQQDGTPRSSVFPRGGEVVSAGLRPRRVLPVRSDLFSPPAAARTVAHPDALTPMPGGPSLGSLRRATPSGEVP